MSETQNNIACLHRKEWQTMMPTPVASAAASFMIFDQTGNSNLAMLVSSATVQYLYHHDEDAFQQIPSGALAGAFAAGACGIFMPWSLTYQANGGSTTTITIAAASYNINGNVRGKVMEFLSGSNIGLRRTITQILTNVGQGTITLTLDSAVTSVASGDKFRVQSGQFYIMNAGTIAANIFKSFDLGTYVWTGLATTNLPATWATDGAMATMAHLGITYLSGTATAGTTATTLENTTKAWTTNSLSNYQLRITAGTALGQIRHVVSNTATVLTVASASGSLSAMTRTSNVVTATVAVDTPNYQVGRGITVSGCADATFNGTFTITNTTVGAGTTKTMTWSQTAANQASAQTATSQDVWAITPDATSEYVIEGCEDHFFLLGNGAVTMYRYSTFDNSWDVMSPGSARAAAPGVGMTADCIGQTGDSGWADETNLLDGRFIYSLRGAAGGIIDRYDVALGTWLPTTGVTYVVGETFTTGTSACSMGRYLYIAKEGTAAIPQRFFKYAIRGNYLEPVTADYYFGGAALLGKKIWIKNLSSAGTIKWLYCWQSTSTNLRRIMLF